MLSYVRQAKQGHRSAVDKTSTQSFPVDSLDDIVLHCRVMVY